jgi:hypothetical protein
MPHLCLKDYADIALITQAIVAVLALILVGLQLRQSNKLARAANANALVEQAIAFNTLLIEHEDLVDLWYNFPKAAGVSDIDKLRYREMLVQWLIIHENIYNQHSQGLLTEETYDPWKQDLVATMQKHGADDPRVLALFKGTFRDRIKTLHDEVKGTK